MLMLRYLYPTDSNYINKSKNKMLCKSPSGLRLTVNANILYLSDFSSGSVSLDLFLALDLFYPYRDYTFIIVQFLF